ncbi:MAG: hypothetical protein GY930_22525 [bacterium]|nr:hypothetical protein [bacterium]
MCTPPIFRLLAAPILVLGFCAFPAWAVPTQSISPSRITRVTRRLSDSVTRGLAPQGAKLIHRDSTNLSPFAACNSNQAWPWTAAFSPGGAHLYVPLFGGYAGQGGCTLLKLDALTLQHQGTIQVQESPEEVVFTTNTNGSMALGFVTNSSASSVSIFDATDAVLTHLAIPVRPGNTFGTAFPFGMAVSPDQSTVWVGTSEGRIFAIDVASRTLDSNRTIDLGAAVGLARFGFLGNQLILPATSYHQNYQGSTAKLILLDPAHPAMTQEVILGTSPTASAFPSPQDFAIRNGKIYVAGFDLGPQVVVADTQTLALDTPIPTGTGHPGGKFQALTISASGLLLVADYTTAEIARIDTNTDSLLGVVPASTYGYGPQELTISPDGQTLLVPTAAGNLVRFDLR